MSSAAYSFWRHRDRSPPEVAVRSEPCDCVYCYHSSKHNQPVSVTQKLNPNSKRNLHNTSSPYPISSRPIFSVTSYAGQSMAGSDESCAMKTNQDSLVMLEDSRTRTLVLACLDGHGTHGHVISQFFKYGLETRLFSQPLWESEPREAISKLLRDLEEEICQFSRVETQFSGTTLVMVVVRGDSLLVVNVGDSRAILGSTDRKGSNEAESSLVVGELDRPNHVAHLVPIPLTTDHKPEVPRELSRILKAGGRVFALSQEGPDSSKRVWLNDEDLPGLAMSRSLGDEVAQSIGVISTPDFCERQLDSDDDCLLVLGTDGLWDYLSNEDVIEMLASKVDSSSGQCVVSLIGEAKLRWERAEGRCDDITACVATLAGRKKQKVC
mmetsp:Transcript_12730/g.20716  ORF Transcript_12730/g.20716 Transcript_12730/m.20716 type:complete len:381 (-) Transcript_12730:43-1185(-)